MGKTTDRSNANSSMDVRCQLVFPVCLHVASVSLETDKFVANCCIPCGKEFQKKFPPQVYGLNIKPINYELC